ncbi:MAG: mycofactocin biosynthesis chaperone MftB [Firmicutes bacterium]|nr:mycofactocin biosynthesis chaperone MftB [Bacillota bacterium]
MPYYKLHENVKVRDESFGLLFYICPTTSLVFVASGNMLKSADLYRGGTAAEFAADMESKQIKTVESLLAKLAQRRLLYVEK